MNKRIKPIIEKAGHTLTGLAQMGIGFVKRADPGAYPDSDVNRQLSKLYFDRARYIESAAQKGINLEVFENELGQYLDKRESILALKLAGLNGKAKTMIDYYENAIGEYNEIQGCTKADVSDLEYAQKLVNDYNFIISERLEKDACEETDRNEAMNKWLSDNFVNIKVGDFSAQKLEIILEDYQYGFVGAFHRAINKKKYEFKKSALKALIDREKFLEVKVGAH